MRAERFPLHQTRLGLFGSTSILLGSDSESGRGNSTHSPVLGLKRAILSASCSLTQIRLFFRSTLTEYVPGVSVGGAKNDICLVSKSTFIRSPAFQSPTQMSPRAMRSAISSAHHTDPSPATVMPYAPVGSFVAT